MPLGVLLWGLGQQSPNIGRATTQHQMLAAQFGECSYGGWWSMGRARHPKSPTPMALPCKEILMCVQCGGVKEVSGDAGLTSLTSPLSRVGWQLVGAIAPWACHSMGIGWTPNGSAAMGDWWLQNKVAGLTLPSCNGTLPPCV